MESEKIHAESAKEEKKIAREYESIDDFEHLSHDFSPAKESGTISSTTDLLKGLDDSTTSSSAQGLPSESYSLPKISNEPEELFKTTGNIINESKIAEAFDKTSDLLDKFSVTDKKAETAEFIQFESSSHFQPEIASKFPISDFSNFMSDDQPLMPSTDKISQEIEKIKPDPIKDEDNFHDTENMENTGSVLKQNIYDELKPSRKSASPSPQAEPEDGFISESEIQSLTPLEPSEPEETEPPRQPSLMDKVTEQDLMDEWKRMVGDQKPIRPQIPVPVPEPVIKQSQEDQGIIQPMQILVSLGLDAWFNPERLHPKVVELLYWRDPKKSGIAFASILNILISLRYFSLISVIAYLSLAMLAVTICLGLYKNVMQIVQKTSDGHPFKEILELDLTLPQEKTRELTDLAVEHVNAFLVELRRLFLFEDIVDSIKFGVMLWCLTYVGACFNGLTLLIIAFVGLFTLPWTYENNKEQINQNASQIYSKISEISDKIKAAIPIGKKTEEKKD